MDFRNGATVHRLWGRLSEGECLAHLQYMDHAEDLAQGLVIREPKGNGIVLIAVCHRSGKTKIFHVDPPPGQTPDCNR